VRRVVDRPHPPQRHLTQPRPFGATRLHVGAKGFKRLEATSVWRCIVAETLTPFNFRIEACDLRVALHNCAICFSRLIAHAFASFFWS
jgi:hypothetical protein